MTSPCRLIAVEMKKARYLRWALPQSPLWNTMVAPENCKALKLRRFRRMAKNSVSHSC